MKKRVLSIKHLVLLAVPIIACLKSHSKFVQGVGNFKLCVRKESYFALNLLADENQSQKKIHSATPPPPPWLRPDSQKTATRVESHAHRKHGSFNGTVAFEVGLNSL